MEEYYSIAVAAAHAEGEEWAQGGTTVPGLGDFQAVAGLQEKVVLVLAVGNPIVVALAGQGSPERRWTYEEIGRSVVA